MFKDIYYFPDYFSLIKSLLYEKSEIRKVTFFHKSLQTCDNPKEIIKVFFINDISFFLFYI